MSMQAAGRVRGFTLIELMVGIVVLAILAGLALPNFRNFSRRSMVTAQANAVLADLQYARSDAITRRVVTMMCASTSGSACLSANTFESGWAVYRETAPGATATFSAADEVLRVTQARQGVSVRLMDTASTPAAVTSLGFNQEGSTLGNKAVNFLVCAVPNGASIGESTTQVPGAQVMLSASGRPSVRPIAAGGSCGS